MKRRELIAALGSVLAIRPLHARAQSEPTQTWPARPVKLIVGFAPGGPTDLIARLVAQKLSEATGKNFFVENVSGAGGNVGAVRAAKSPPDGYTFLVTGGNITNNQLHGACRPSLCWFALRASVQRPEGQNTSQCGNELSSLHAHSPRRYLRVV